ncbi:ferritin-like domain-containing protein [Holophaga foetida]|uniref:ferritin-like domain-containing protein n=1 Tax=Holophaga foetida TaxID=35839 RepID=UPI0002472621|nr:ferritin family protein [Holophaga foetida]
MSFDFNADDIFEMAEQIERNGASFYREAELGVSDPRSKALLAQLAAMEDDHENAYADLRKGLNEAENTPTVFDPDDEAVRYLRAMADTRVFFEQTVDFRSMASILKTAIQMEKDSIAFYLGLKDLVPEALGRKRVDDIIREEMGHIQLLSRELLAQQ